MTDNAHIELAVKYLHDRGIELPVEILPPLVREYPLTKSEMKRFADGVRVKDIPSREMKQALSYQPIRSNFWASVYDAVYNFLDSRQQSRTASRDLRLELGKAYTETMDIAYQDGGGSLPVDADTLALGNAFISQQYAYVDSLFETLKIMRKDGDFDAISEAFKKANSWSDTLDGFYNLIRLSAMGNRMLTFVRVKDTKESCDDCKRLRGKRHRASWWISHDFVPPKGAGLACSAGGHCGDMLVDDTGKEVTI